MTESNDTTTLVERLQSVQSQLKAPKGQTNKFGNYNYRSAEDILESVKPLLAANGLALIVSDDIVQIGQRVYVKSSASVIDAYGAQIGSNGFAREAETRKGMDDSQITGSASSYARKYALNGLFAIDDTKDSDATNTHGKEKNSKPQQNETVNALDGLI
tara:strand:+ start:555 stop:1031 length:477 start_codon:yes stop_codon:yes gene_type:complete